jgi:hypothetical protein
VRVRSSAWLLAFGMLGCATAPVHATEENVERLEPGACRADRDAIRALCEIHRQGDGAVAEYAAMVLGSTIRPYPVVFLEELDRELRQCDVYFLNVVVGNFGPDLVDEFELQRREAQARIAALKTVDAAELATARDRCIALLQGI